jgi:hypothetical protein
MSSDAGRKLSAVGSTPERERSPAEARRGRHERAALAILGVLLAVCLVGLALSMGRNARLGRENGELSAELESTRAVLGAYESRFSEVRAAVAHLNALLEGGPAPAPAETPTDAATEPPTEAPAP